MEILVPNLHVSGHRLAVQPKIIERCAEKNVHQMIFTRVDCQLIFIPVNLAPAMRPPISIAHGPVMTVGPSALRPWLIEPARLGHAHGPAAFVPAYRMEQ